MRLLHLGNVVIDLVLTVGDLPTRGGDVIASSTTTAAGGGFNVMAAAVRQGLPTLYAGAHGTGPFGSQAREALERAGVELLHPAREDQDTGFVVTLVDASGERTFVTSRGAEATLTSEDLPDPVVGRDLVYLSGYSLLHDSNREALIPWLGAISADVPVFFDPGPLVAEIPEAALEAVFARADWWSCNAGEATAVTGLAEPLEAARSLVRRTGRADVLVRTGAAGCFLAVRGAEVRHIDGFAVEAVDLNGAGDAHSGTFLAGIADGKEPAEAARRANAAAALAVTRRGPATSPTRDELEAYLRGR
ncbi:PfkB family carbohydrate kinase [Kribbella sp. VKM Ac-2568]|uniref:PfkB family carbohydrate kinase n=1 Tax=Kribbella sp. VKM Ac-2568 TaxID=2512219 RepID=UPI0010453AFB|nr:PfkB family carbohydrate kinase [Kribbella sp. VKM Ac-2568]TCM51770.1 sugar/nucleoside kinase (ribokinase family) [Kribbella sp. VKM Ac-2568]